MNNTSLSLFGSNRLPLRDGEPWRVDVADATSWLKNIGSETVDIIVTDPAYVSLDKYRAVGTTTRLASGWFNTVPNSYFEGFFAECFRVLQRDAHLYVMCDAETMFAIKPMGEAAGFRFWKPIVWDKLKMGMGYHYRARCEFILFFEKGTRRLNSLGVTDVLEAEECAPDIVKMPRVAGAGAYPTEKPVGLLQTFISQSSSHGDIVADPFCGSGSTGHAALMLGRRFVGCDVSLAAAEISNARLRLVESAK